MNSLNWCSSHQISITWTTSRRVCGQNGQDCVYEFQTRTDADRPRNYVGSVADAKLEHGITYGCTVLEGPKSPFMTLFAKVWILILNPWEASQKAFAMHLEVCMEDMLSPNVSSKSTSFGSGPKPTTMTLRGASQPAGLGQAPAEHPHEPPQENGDVLSEQANANRDIEALNF